MDSMFKQNSLSFCSNLYMRWTTKTCEEQCVTSLFKFIIAKLHLPNQDRSQLRSAMSPRALWFWAVTPKSVVRQKM